MMLRSIISVTIGVLAAVTFIIYVSFIASAGVITDAGPVEDMHSLPFSNQISIVVVWFAGTLIGGVISSLGARRWAPAAWVVAATMALFALTNFSSIPAPLWMPFSSITAIGAAGWLSIMATKASYVPPEKPKGGLGL